MPKASAILPIIWVLIFTEPLSIFTIALGQTYFAIQTRRAEVADTFNQLDENNKRRVVRGNIKQWNQLLIEAAHNAGVITNEDFAIFQNAGYMELYGGMTVADIHSRKGLKNQGWLSPLECE